MKRQEKWAFDMDRRYTLEDRCYMKIPPDSMQLNRQRNSYKCEERQEHRSHTHGRPLSLFDPSSYKEAL